MTDLSSLHIIYKHTDLWIKADGALDRVRVEGWLRKVYEQIEGYAASDGSFLSSLHPLEVPETAPEVIRRMARCAMRAGVGPMAGVAGAVADFVGEGLSEGHRRIICNNGGDIFYKSPEKQGVYLSAPGSPFHGKVCMHVPPAAGKGLCTSSGITGHSVNMGRSYAVTILAENACLADVWATAVSNRIGSRADLDRVLDWCAHVEDIEGVVILVDHYMGVWGEIELSGDQ
ncbi:MAG: UPF0280 family protein [bacterium]